MERQFYIYIDKASNSKTSTEGWLSEAGKPDQQPSYRYLVDTVMEMKKAKAFSSQYFAESFLLDFRLHGKILELRD